MILTVDIGNSRIKCASWRADKIVNRGAVTYAKNNPSESFDELFSAISAASEELPSRVLAVCVADD
ncbi:MAG: type III pantothenate kinase, partial [Gammaproteobacteria bacterium]|nr:type III pantothenate kinase [Gammaproteobacteria bacterium]